MSNQLHINVRNTMNNGKLFVRVTVILLFINVVGFAYATDIRNITISKNELKNVTEELFVKSSHELYEHIIIKYQGNTTSNFTDNAPERLLYVPADALSLLPTTRSFIKLLDNYELNASLPEVVTDEELAEEDEFIDNLLKTDVILHSMNFLSGKGFFKKDFAIYKETLKKMWFHMYSRSKTVNGSSGFEHVFLAENKPRKGIIGLHNWIFFALEESANRINYHGFARNVEFAGKLAAAQIYFTYDGKRKMSTIFIGTPPELEIAVYTLCFFVKPNKRCRVSFAGVNFSVQTYLIASGQEKLVGSAYPLI